MERKSSPGDLLHSDLCGPIQPQSIGKANYFGTFTDDATRMVFMYPLTTKKSSEVLARFKELRNEFERDGRKIKALRTDGGGEFEKEFEAYLKKDGIKHEITPPYTPEQNGVAERLNRTIVERVRTILAETNLPKSLWAELAATVVYLKNRTPTSTLETTPYEACYGKKPDLSHLRAIGTKALVQIPKEKRKKLEYKTKSCILIGYQGRNLYRFYDPEKHDVIIARDVTFTDENRTPATVGITVENSKPIDNSIEVQPLAEPTTSTQEEEETEMEEQVGEIEKNVLKKGKEREKELEEEVGERRISSRKNKGQPSQKFGDLSWPKKSSKTARTATTLISHIYRLNHNL
jgi:transposase InsO family protein